MELTTIVFEDGTTLSSGACTCNAIRSAQLKRSVNTGRELTLGSVCAAVFEAEIISPNGNFTPDTGSEITVYRGEEKLGIFRLEKPTRVSAHLLRLTAYDRVSRLDQDLTDWLATLADWPYSLQKFSWLVAAQCGLELENDQIPNGSYPVEKFTATAITGRQLIRWAAEAAGCYCIATTDGKLRFDWYTPADAPAWYYSGSLRFEDYTVAPIQRVQISRDETDVGLCYPADATGNTYCIRGNYLLTGENGLPELAANLHNRLSQLLYTPCRVMVQAFGGRAGDQLVLTDANGARIPMLVMTETMADGRSTLECTGSPDRQSITAVNQQSYGALTGKILQLQTRVDGLQAENRDAKDNASSLQLTVEGITTQVRKQTEQLQQLTRLSQTAEALQLQVQTVQTQGVSRVTTETGFTFDDQGLQIRKTGSDLIHRMDHRGMQVLRGAQTLLQADENGVQATDVQVNNYLLVGDHARFENHGENRTACYFVGADQ